MTRTAAAAPTASQESRPAVSKRRPTLLVQIAVALAIVGTAPLALAVWQLVGINQRALYDQLLRTHIASARTAADSIDGFLEGRRALARALAADPRLVDDPASETAQALLRDSLAAWSENGVAGVAVLDSAGTPVVQVRTREAAEVVNAALDSGGTGAHDGTRLLARDGAPWAVVPLPLANGAGTLVLVTDARPVARSLAPEELGAEARRILFDRAGAPLWGAAAGAADLAPQLKASAFSGNLSGAGRFTGADDRQVVAAWSSADDGRWIVVSTQPAAIAEAAARRMTQRSAIAILGSLALVALLSAGAWRGLVRPLRALLAAQRAEAADAKGATPGAAVESETAQLARAVAELEQRAKDRAAVDSVFLGRYQVVKLIGSGGMGSVFRGWDPRLQRTVALKTIRVTPSEPANPFDSKAAAPAEDESAKLLAEAVAVARIAHPNVVGVFDAEQSGGAAFVAMELVDGIGLDRYLEKRARLDWREVVPLGAAISSGLAAAHNQGVLQRDIKPGNVLLGHDGAIKIADFGLATFLNRLHEAPGKVFGTPGFLSPEALQGMPIDARSDLYAMGVVLHRAATGRYPFRGGSFRDLVVQTVRDPAPSPGELEEYMPREVGALIAALLAKDPEQRLAPAAEVARRFEDIARTHALVWRLDYTASAASADSVLGSAATTMPTLRLDADLA